MSDAAARRQPARRLRRRPHARRTCCSPRVGVTLGTLVGVLPGIGPALTIALLLPLTFNFSDPVGAFILFAGIYAGGMYGGSTTSILLNTPGESASVATAIEGFQMAKRGRARAALATAAIGSFVAGTIGIVAADARRPADGRPRRQVPRRQDYFALAMLAFASVTALVGRSIIRGWASLSHRPAHRLRRHRPAHRPVAAHVRRRPARQRHRHRDRRRRAVRRRRGAAHGGQAAQRAATRSCSTPTDGEELATAGTPPARWLSRRDAKRSWKPWLRGAAIGFPFGALPAGGAEVPTFLSYSVEKRLSKHPEEFGKGAIEGVAGPEAANNASFSGTLVPLLTLGLPTSATAAIMLARFQIFNLQPGPAAVHAEQRAGVDADRVALRRQRDAAAAQPAADPALGEGAGDPAPAAVLGHPRVRHARRVLAVGQHRSRCWSCTRSACSGSSCAATSSRSRR